MNRPASRPQDEHPSLFTAAAAEPPVVSPRFWVQLLRYRPIILLGSLWLGLICIAAVAYSRLLFAGAPPAPLEIEPAPTETSQPLQRQPRPDDIVSTNPPSARPDSRSAAPATEPTSPEPLPAEIGSEGVSSWALAALVGICAAGCFWLQRQAIAATQPAKARPLNPVLPKGAANHPPRRLRRDRRRPQPQPTGPKRLQPFSEQDQVVVPQRFPGPSPAGPSPTGPSPTGPTTTGSAASPSRPPSQPAQAAAAGSAVPTRAVVVPPSETMSLDYPEGSIAHSLDIRQRRSLSSFL